MDAAWWNGPDDREWHRDLDRAPIDGPSEMRCDDCGGIGFDGFSYIGPSAKTLCGTCKRKREAIDPVLLFDPRSLRHIEAERRKGAA